MNDTILINFDELEEVRDLLIKSCNNAKNANNYIHEGNQHGYYYVKNIDEEVNNISDLFNKVLIIEESKNQINSSIINTLSQYTNNQNNDDYRNLDLSSNNDLVDSPFNIDWDSLTYEEKLQWLDKYQPWHGEPENIEEEQYNITNQFPNAANIFYYNASNNKYNGKSYGGNQNIVYDIWALRNNYTNPDDNPYSIEAHSLETVISKYFNFNHLSIEEKKLRITNILTVFENCGCAYIAIANAISAYFISLPNGSQIFQEKFGLDIYTKMGYNIEAIALDVFLHRFKDFTYEELIENAHGVSAVDFCYLASNYLNSKGIKAECSFSEPLYLNEEYLFDSINDYVQTNQFVIIGASGYDSTNVANNEIYSVNGGHGTLITEITEDKKIIISNWGAKVEFDYNSLHGKDGDWLHLLALNIYLPASE